MNAAPATPTPTDTAARHRLAALAEIVATLEAHDRVDAAAALGWPAPDVASANTYLLGCLREAARQVVESLGVTP